MHARSRHPHVVLLLATAFLVAQWMGLIHRVEHPIWLEIKAAFSSSTSGGNEVVGVNPAKQRPHHCAAFDATAIGDTFALFLAQPMALVTVSLAAVWPPIVSWQAPATCCFLPRGPPRF